MWPKTQTLVGYGLVLAAAVLPIHGGWPLYPPALALIGLGFFVQGPRNWVGNLTAQPHLIWLCAYFVVHVIAAFWGSNLESALQKLVLKLPLLIIPVAVLGVSIQANYIKRARQTWVGATTAVCLFLLARGLWLLRTSGQLQVYVDFSPWLHPSYLALLATMALFWQIFAPWNLKYKRAIFLRIGSSIVLFSAIMALSSRSQIVALVVCTLGGLAVVTAQRWGIGKGMVRLALALALALPFLFNLLMDNQRMRIALTEFQALKLNAPTPKGTGVRVVLWKESLALAAQNPWGYGTGNGKATLIQQLKLHGFANLADKELNSHQQFLGDLLSVGVAGVFCLLMAFTLALRQAWQLGNLAGTLALMALLMSFLTESMLERQTGVMLTALAFVICTRHDQP